MNRRNKRMISFKIRRAIFKLIMLIIGISAFLPPNFLEANTEVSKDKIDLTNYVFNLTNDSIKSSIDQMLIVSYEIDSIEAEDDELISSVVIAYTLFGIPYAEVVTNKDSAYINKKFLFRE
ncbi:hypothetical protein [Psychrobacillus vulpis]|uniref:Uncharacterized protein n=1 Tax=Psychrobacillus vulpis TaxID=2325572 RepID=A0A544TQJ9_9BACI|nr:hypothetical protein [Psychrobacillus vulpis]TQR19723.1 hypothetical protein FG384_10925 [Psychrobacillus vulpis]